MYGAGARLVVSEEAGECFKEDHQLYLDTYLSSHSGGTEGCLGSKILTVPVASRFDSTPIKHHIQLVPRQFSCLSICRTISIGPLQSVVF